MGGGSGRRNPTAGSNTVGGGTTRASGRCRRPAAPVPFLNDTFKEEMKQVKRGLFADNFMRLLPDPLKGNAVAIRPEPLSEDDIEAVTVERCISKRKAAWWQLPKDMSGQVPNELASKRGGLLRSLSTACRRN
jgi:hypothetical protein